MTNEKGFEPDFATESSALEAETIELYRRYINTLSRYAATMTKDRTIVQDAIQETFLRYFIARIDGQQVENPRAWILGMFRYYIRSCIRKSNSTIPLQTVGILADSEQNLEEKFRQNEVLENAFHYFSPRERECVQLRIEGFSYNEIAQILQIQASTVGTLMANVVKKIRKIRGFLAKKW